MPLEKFIKGEPDCQDKLNRNFDSTVDKTMLDAHNKDPAAHGTLNLSEMLKGYAKLGHQHEISDIAGLSSLLAEYKDGIARLQDLLSNNMPGALIFTADFSSLSGITIRDGVWNAQRHTIDA